MAKGGGNPCHNPRGAGGGQFCSTGGTKTGDKTSDRAVNAKKKQEYDPYWMLTPQQKARMAEHQAHLAKIDKESGLDKLHLAGIRQSQTRYGGSGRRR